MYNKIILMGRICNDLELKNTPNGVPVLSFRIAVDRKYQVKGEERKADFFNVVTWRGQAEFVSKYFSKGRMVMIDGELQTRQYVDKNNITQNVVEIVADSVYFTGERPPQQQQGYNSGGGGGFNGGGNNFGGNNFGGGGGGFGGGNYGGGYQNQPQAQPHPAETANSAPTTMLSDSLNSDFSANSGNDDDYPF
ncbi:MAG: single-stranded DNA-binding protein [Oscillospiraceae bacterium]|nr:single-stranded DNA-binding protein [Oscillospiraceae bacterium]